jgi:hypothetical protein
MASTRGNDETAKCGERPCIGKVCDRRLRHPETEPLVLTALCHRELIGIDVKKEMEVCID